MSDRPDSRTVATSRAAGEPSVSSGDEARLAALLEEYLAQIERGERPDRVALVSRHPDLADQLRECLDGLDLVRQVAPELRDASGPASPPQVLGDFRLLHEVGRGGMGVVYEAEQISLRRRVALKILPFAAVLDKRNLQRFKNEAVAAATLDHPHIVSIYSVGEERGVHYYAMQLIDGQTLADTICELRRIRQGEMPTSGSADSPITEALLASSNVLTTSGTSDAAPTMDRTARQPHSSQWNEPAPISAAADARQAAEFFRSAARIGIQAAEALQHAHDQGVLHRDIKPSNLLLDAEAQVYVTDFGLARIEADPGLTMIGDIVGTLRYMAPEQALAKRVVIDHRADVYSLGATLYELLTMQPAFGETDRSDLLKQIAFEEPLPLRKLDRRIPAELDTIVLKAMAKQPDERYQTAQQLADDLRAFLEHRPIKATPPTLLNRAAKWSRRHMPLVASATLSTAALLVMGVVMLTISNAQIRKESAAKATALADKNAALNTARKAVDQMLVRVSYEQLKDVPLAEPFRQALMEDALAFYEGFLKEAETDVNLHNEMSNVLHSMGTIQQELGHYEEARELDERGIDIRKELVAADPNDPTLWEQLAKDEQGLAYKLSLFPPGTKNQSAAAHYRQALEIYTELERDWPKRPQPTAMCLNFFARAARNRGDNTEAERLWREAIQRNEKYLEHARQNEPAQRSDGAAIERSQEQLMQVDGLVYPRMDVCWACVELADMIRKRPADAAVVLQHGLQHSATLLEEHPRSHPARMANVSLNYGLARAYRSMGRLEEAVPLFHQTIDEIDSLCSDFPEDQWSWDFARDIHRGTIRLLAQSGYREEAEKTLCQICDWIEEIAPRVPSEAVPQTGLVECAVQLTILSQSTGPSEKSEIVYRRAIAILAQKTTNVVEDYWKRAGLGKELGQTELAGEVYQAIADW